MSLKPTELHVILAGKTAWTDQLWEQAVSLISGELSPEDVRQMLYLVYSHERETVTFSSLRELRLYPPTFLLGAYDFMRQRRELYARLAKL